MTSPPLRENLGAQLATRHARALLRRLGSDAAPAAASDHPALAWRRAGLSAITGWPDAPGLVAPVALTASADGVLAALRALQPAALLPANGALLLGERARLLGFSRQGTIAPNGFCRLLQAQDGVLALNLARLDDWDLLPAWLGAPAKDWDAICALVARQSLRALLAQGRRLGLALAAQASRPPPRAAFQVTRLGQGRGKKTRTPLVVDLSSLWAGPLAGALLRAMGATVVKVESRSRPDGARGGNKPFYDLLNAGKASLCLDFSDPDQIARLRRLLGEADIVIESSRPRALAALGLPAEEFAASGATWLSITAHGRTGEEGFWVGFGDDAAVAGGLSAAMRRGWGQSLFAGDAIADPLTGLTAALAGWAGFRAGGARLISLALADIVADACALYEAGADELAQWQAAAAADQAPLYGLRAPQGGAAPLGADNARWLGEI